MKVEITGKIEATEESVYSALSEVINKYIEKYAEDNPDSANQLGENLENVYITELTATLGFKLKGQDSLMTMTVNPLGQNHPELLVVTAKTDDDGVLQWETLSDNEENSLFTDVEAAIAEGLPTDFTEIESKYADYELTPVKTVELDDFEVVILIKELKDEDVAVVHYLKDDKLIQEVEIELNSEKTIDTLASHFEQLIE